MPLFSGTVGSRSATLRVERDDEFEFSYLDLVINTRRTR